MKARAANADVAIIGGGPAGLSAALILARACRSVVIVDAGEPRNRQARALHGYLTRDSISPRAFAQAGRRDVNRYGVKMLADRITNVRRDRHGFRLISAGRVTLRARAILLATGVVDVMPTLPGIERFYGVSVHHCPFCDGWEWRGKALAAYGRGRAAAGLALALRAWSDDVTAFFDGPARLTAAERHRLAECDIVLCEQAIARLHGRGARLAAVVLNDGRRIARDALFFNTGQHTRSTLLEQLGCDFDARGAVRVDRRDCTRIPGVFVAGDALREVQFVVSAAGQGATAAVGIHHYLQQLDRRVFD